MQHSDDCYGKVGLSACHCVGAADYCNCATFGNAHSCPIHTQADFEAAVSAGAETPSRDDCICPDDAGAHPECPYHNSVGVSAGAETDHMQYHREEPCDCEPPADGDVLRHLTEIVGKALYGWSDDEPNGATGSIALIKVAQIAASVYEAGYRHRAQSEPLQPCPRPRHDEHCADGHWTDG